MLTQKNIKMDRDQIEWEDVKLYDPANKCHYRVLIAQEEEKTLGENNDSEWKILPEEQSAQNVTIWTQTETLALINIFALHKEKFKDFKKRSDQWKFISHELAKIDIQKIPEKCENKWKNLLRIYRQYKNSNKSFVHSRFEFFNELDNIVSGDPQYQYYFDTSSSSSSTTEKVEKVNNNHVESNGIEYKGKIESRGKRRKCCCGKSEKQKRHEDRLAIISKKMDIEERKVKVFEEYLQFLKSNPHKA